MRYKIFLTILIVLYFVSWVSTGVRVKNINIKQYEFSLKAGDRILVIDTNLASRVYTRIEPKEARIFDLKIPEGKSMYGILNYK